MRKSFVKNLSEQYSGKSLPLNDTFYRALWGLSFSHDNVVRAQLMEAQRSRNARPKPGHESDLINNSMHCSFYGYSHHKNKQEDKKFIPRRAETKTRTLLKTTFLHDKAKLPSLSACSATNNDKRK